ncbi:MAG TPA: acyl-CoA dehydrogenase family protein [Acidimicrobiales bacterium]|nr:acyl-CoA dehydrogenase family protein [Acidimicrobiales bacterium]
MRLSDSRAEARFRAELGEWLAGNEPAADRMSDPPLSSGHMPGWARDWQRALFDAGWLVPRWPAELGGREASAVEQMIYLEELSRRRLPRTVNPQGLDVCAPTLIDMGDDRQRDEWVPATLHGETTWCVAVDAVEAPGGESAPLTVSERDRELVVRGTVPAPAGAAHADRCLCGVRAVAAGRRFEEVGVVAVDLSRPGVTRPDGDGGELSLDDVVVDPADVVGAADQGWPALQSVRARLRSVRWITSLLAIQRALDALTDVGRGRGLADDAVFRHTLAGHQVEADAVRALAYRALAKQGTGRANPELAMLPLVTRETEQRLYQTGLECLGTDGLDLGLDGPRSWPSGSWASEWLGATADSAAAGGLAAERDRVAGRVLGLHLR